MKIPDIIYLQLDEDGEPGTWCADKINESDIAYTRVSTGVHNIMKTYINDPGKCVSHIYDREATDAADSIEYISVCRVETFSGSAYWHGARLSDKAEFHLCAECARAAEKVARRDGTQANPFSTLGEAIAHCSTDGPGKAVWWAFNPNSSITLLEEIEDDDEADDEQR